MLKPLSIAATLLAACQTFAIADTLRYEAVWSKGSGSNIFSTPLSHEKFIAKGVELTTQNLRLIDVESEIHNGKRIYTGVWVPGTGSNIFEGPIGPIKFRAARKARRAQGMRLVDFEILRKPNGERRYLGVWRAGTGIERLTRPMRKDAFFSTGERLTASGLRLVDVEVERINGRTLYSGLFRSGTGSNLITAPLRRPKFITKRDEMVANGLELVDVERIRIGGVARFVGVWSSGSGKSRLSAPRKLKKFLKLGAKQTAAGLRTRDVELIRVVNAATSGSDSSAGGQTGSNVTVTTADLPNLPQWIQLSGSGGGRLVLDFGTIIDDQPRLTLPVNFLPDFLPRNDAGELVIPDNFCGIRVVKAGGFQWQKNGVTITDFPYNRVNNVASLPGENDFLGGIDFTGPIGQCAKKNKPWQFFQPITQHGGDSPTPGMKLVIEMQQDSRIEFLNFNIQPGKGLDPRKLFSDKPFKILKSIAKTFEKIMKEGGDNGYCSIDRYVMKVCEKNPSQCPVGEDFSSPC